VYLPIRDWWKMTPAELIHELVSECSPGEQLRLKAWANASRVDVVEPTPVQVKKYGDHGPDYSEDKARVASAVIGSLELIKDARVDWNLRPWKPGLFRRAIISFMDWRSSRLRPESEISSVRASKIPIPNSTAGSEKSKADVKTHLNRGR
jgi:hypothetical protein